jgi:hypothetical protein
VRRSLSFILVLSVGLVQGLSLCACRAEQLVSFTDPHGHPADHAETPGDAGPNCFSDELPSRAACDSHAQAKPSVPGSWLVGAVLSKTEVVPWAGPALTGAPRTAESIGSASPLFGRSLPLLI